MNIPCIEAFAGQGPIHILQIDAHLDFVDERHGVRVGHGSPMRRAAEKDYVSGLTQVGIRNVSSTARDGYEPRARWGSTSCRCASSAPLAPQVAARIPAGARVYVTLDIDGFAPLSPPALVRPAMAGSFITRCWSCFSRSRRRMRLWASIWSRWPPTMTRGR